MAGLANATAPMRAREACAARPMLPHVPGAAPPRAPPAGRGGVVQQPQLAHGGRRHAARRRHHDEGPRVPACQRRARRRRGGGGRAGHGGGGGVSGGGRQAGPLAQEHAAQAEHAGPEPARGCVLLEPAASARSAGAHGGCASPRIVEPLERLRSRLADAQAARRELCASRPRALHPRAAGMVVGARPDQFTGAVGVAIMPSVPGVLPGQDLEGGSECEYDLVEEGSGLQEDVSSHAVDGLASGAATPASGAGSKETSQVGFGLRLRPPRQRATGDGRRAGREACLTSLRQRRRSVRIQPARAGTQRSGQGTRKVAWQLHKSVSVCLRVWGGCRRRSWRRCWTARRAPRRARPSF